MKVQLLSHTPNPEELVSKSAMLCYSPVGVTEIQEDLTNGKIEKFVQHLVDIGHESPMEHILFSFGIEGVSRITEIQLIRHRIGCSYSIQSGRYVNRDSPEFVVPPRIKSCRPALKRYSEIMEESIKAYNDLFLILMLKQMDYDDDDIEDMLEDEMIYLVDNLFQSNKKKYKTFEKMCVEDARYTHLQSLSTKLVCSMNARALLNFFSLRCCTRSQWEIRALANKMLKLVKEVSPNIFKNAGASCVRGYCPEGSKTCGRLDRIA